MSEAFKNEILVALSSALMTYASPSTSTPAWYVEIDKLDQIAAYMAKQLDGKKSNTDSSIDPDGQYMALVLALQKTARYESIQDRAEAILKLLQV